MYQVMNRYFILFKMHNNVTEQLKILLLTHSKQGLLGMQVGSFRQLCCKGLFYKDYCKCDVKWAVNGLKTLQANPLLVHIVSTSVKLMSFQDVKVLGH